MKKIFAIALALVMVLSMASAFAMTCNGVYDWACPTTTYDCGKVKVEVVPFIRSNTACVGESTFSVSTCAASVVGERVYYGVKLTIDKGLNEEWYEAITADSVVLEYTNLAATETATTEMADAAWTLPTWANLVADEVDEKGGIFWLDQAGSAWVEDEDFDNACVSAAWVLKNKVKVCATIESANEFNGAEVADWAVAYKKDAKALNFTKDETYRVQLLMDKDDKVVRGVVYLWDATNEKWAQEAVVVDYDNGQFVLSNGTRVGYDCAPYSYLKKVLDYFGINFGTCVTEKAINANFGWDDEIESCFTWSTNAAAVVDAECVVAIPKTGDASVLAWLF